MNCGSGTGSIFTNLSADDFIFRALVRARARALPLKRKATFRKKKKKEKGNEVRQGEEGWETTFLDSLGPSDLSSISSISSITRWQEERKTENRKGVAVSLWFFLSSLSYFWPFHVVVYLVLFSTSGSHGDPRRETRDGRRGARDGDLENAHGAMQAAVSFHGRRMIAEVLYNYRGGSDSSRDSMTDESQMIK